jgi:hypothetical protein
MLYICIFSNKFDLKQTIRVLHTFCLQYLVLFNFLAVLCSKKYARVLHG